MNNGEVGACILGWLVGVIMCWVLIFSTSLSTRTVTLDEITRAEMVCNMDDGLAAIKTDAIVWTEWDAICVNGVAYEDYPQQLDARLSTTNESIGEKAPSNTEVGKVNKRLKKEGYGE